MVMVWAVCKRKKRRLDDVMQKQGGRLYMLTSRASLECKHAEHIKLTRNCLQQGVACNKVKLLLVKLPATRTSHCYWSHCLQQGHLYAYDSGGPPQLLLVKLHATRGGLAY